jgi:hypothetical protein
MTLRKMLPSACLVNLLATTLIAATGGAPPANQVVAPARETHQVTGANVRLDRAMPAHPGRPLLDPEMIAGIMNSSPSGPVEPDCGPAPARGAQGRGGVLFAPACADDSPTFRAALSAYLGGAPVDYWDARLATPTLTELSQYDSVLTCAYSGYADPVGMGDVLADYVDAGGRVILGQFCYAALAGRIMTPGYCPVTVSTNEPAV